MIYSVKFEKKHDKDQSMGYLYQKEYDMALRKGKTIEDYEQEKNKTETISLKGHTFRRSYSRNEIYNKYFKKVCKGYKNKRAIKALVDKEIRFKPNINVLFGPNGCGKSTILKSLAHGCLCGVEHNLDGWTNIKKFEPIQFWKFNTGVQANYDIKAIIAGHAGNPFQMEWDGVPVYYLDIHHLLTNTSLDGFQNGTVHSTGEGLLFSMERNSLSSGQLMYSMLDRVYGNIIEPKTMEMVMDDFQGLKSISMNDAWFSLYQAVEEYYKGFIKDTSSNRFTLIIDEPDRNLDLASSYELWYEIMPNLANHFQCQIIVATHNPFVISKGVTKNPIYNVISLDKKFTKDIKTKLSNVHF